MVSITCNEIKGFPHGNRTQRLFMKQCSLTAIHLHKLFTVHNSLPGLIRNIGLSKVLFTRTLEGLNITLRKLVNIAGTDHTL